MISLLVMALRSLRYLKKTRVSGEPHHPCQPKNMGVSQNSGFSPQIIHILIGFFHYFHHPFWGKIPYFWKHPYRLDEKCILCGMKMRNLFQSVSLFYSCKIQTKYKKQQHHSQINYITEVLTSIRTFTSGGYVCPKVAQKLTELCCS